MKIALTMIRRVSFDLCYLVVLLLLFPWLAVTVLVRGRGVGSLGERFGSWKISFPQRERIWIHAVSVGELQAVDPLLRELTRVRPGAEFVISTTTTTARDIARTRYPEIPVRLYPLDFSWCVQRVLNSLRPQLIVLVELEVWPQMVLEAYRRGIPIVIVNGRISERSVKRFALGAPIVRPLFSRITEVHASDSRCAERFVRFGVESSRVFELGNLKLDRWPLSRPSEIRRRYETQFGYPRSTLRWVAGCTHPGEEELILAAFQELRTRFGDLSLLLAPRHIERAGAVATRASEHGFSVRLTHGSFGESGVVEAPEVVVLNQVGKLAELYADADVAFVGGSLIERGGHNILEPVLAGVATLHGPHMSNFRGLVELLTAGGACQQVESSQLTDAVEHYLVDREQRQESVTRGLSAIERSRGAAERSASRIAGILESRNRREARAPLLIQH